MSEERSQTEAMEPMDGMDHNQHNRPEPLSQPEGDRGRFPRATRVAEPLDPDQIRRAAEEMTAKSAEEMTTGSAEEDIHAKAAEGENRTAEKEPDGSGEESTTAGPADEEDDSAGGGVKDPAGDADDSAGDADDSAGDADGEDGEEAGDHAEGPEEAEEAEDTEDTEAPAFAGGTVRASGVAAARSAKQMKRSRKHRKRNRVLKVFFVILLVAAFFAVANMQAFEITEIAVIGNKTVSDKKIRKLSQIRKGDSIFFVNPLLAGSRIKKNYYIEHVNIDRHLPGTVEIIVKERQAAAQFVMRNAKNKKRFVCVDQDGMVIGISKKQKKVTLVINVSVVKAEKGSQLKVDDKGVYHSAMDLISAARDGDMYFKRIFIKGSLVHAYIYDDLMVSGRLPNVMESLANGTLKSVVYKLYQDDVSEGTINIGDNNYCSFTP